MDGLKLAVGRRIFIIVDSLVPLEYIIAITLRKIRHDTSTFAASVLLIFYLFNLEAFGSFRNGKFGASKYRVGPPKETQQRVRSMSTLRREACRGMALLRTISLTVKCESQPFGPCQRCYQDLGASASTTCVVLTASERHVIRSSNAVQTPSVDKESCPPCVIERPIDFLID